MDRIDDAARRKLRELRHHIGTATLTATDLAHLGQLVRRLDRRHAQRTRRALRRRPRAA